MEVISIRYGEDMVLLTDTGIIIQYLQTLLIFLMTTMQEGTHSEGAEPINPDRHLHFCRVFLSNLSNKAES